MMSENVPNSESPTPGRSQTFKKCGNSIQIYVQPMRSVVQMGWDRGEGQHAGQCERGFYGEQRSPGTIEDSFQIINVVVFMTAISRL